jgi:predicted DNA-binding transcriptional regulator YafY
MKLERLLSIVVMLLNRGRVSAPELAVRFGVSVRTIYRDFDSIGKAGIPLVSVQGVGGGYEIMEGFTISRGVFSESDIGSMLAALKGMNAALEDGEIDDAIGKLSALAKPGARRAMDEIVLDVEPWGYTAKRTAKLEKLRRAISDRAPVRILYRDSNGTTSERTVEPMSLVLKNGTWYLYAFCRLRGDERLFRLSGISSAVPLLARFERRDLSYEEFAKRSSVEFALEDFIVEFEAGAANLIEDSFDPASIERLAGGKLRVRMRMPDADWAYDMILGYGTRARVVGPEKAVSRFIERLRAIGEMY